MHVLKAHAPKIYNTTKSLMADKRDLLVNMAQYGMVGLFNTALSLSIIFALQFGSGVNPHIANTIGYIAGVISGFLLNRIFVFGKANRLAKAATRYVGSALAAFALNQGMLWVLRHVLGSGALMAIAAQVIAMGSYTVVFFLLCRYWVFQSETAPTAVTG